MSESPTINIKGCSSCGCDHDQVDVFPLHISRLATRPTIDGVPVTGWAMCPVNHCPILIASGERRPHELPPGNGYGVRIISEGTPQSTVVFTADGQPLGPLEKLELLPIEAAGNRALMCRITVPVNHLDITAVEEPPREDGVTNLFDHIFAANKTLSGRLLTDAVLRVLDSEGYEVRPKARRRRAIEVSTIVRNLLVLVPVDLPEDGVTVKRSIEVSGDMLLVDIEVVGIKSGKSLLSSRFEMASTSAKIFGGDFPDEIDRFTRIAVSNAHANAFGPTKAYGGPVTPPDEAKIEDLTPPADTV